MILSNFAAISSCTIGGVSIRTWVASQVLQMFKSTPWVVKEVILLVLSHSAAFRYKLTIPASYLQRNATYLSQIFRYNNLYMRGV